MYDKKEDFYEKLVLKYLVSETIYNRIIYKILVVLGRQLEPFRDNSPSLARKVSRIFGPSSSLVFGVE